MQRQRVLVRADPSLSSVVGLAVNFAVNLRRGVRPTPSVAWRLG